MVPPDISQRCFGMRNVTPFRYAVNLWDARRSTMRRRASGCSTPPSACRPRTDGTRSRSAASPTRPARARAVYALFESKQGLEQALHEVMFTRLRDLMQGREQTDDPRQDLINLAMAYRLWAIERPERYVLAMHRFVGQNRRPRSPQGVAVSARPSSCCATPSSAATTPACSSTARPRGGRDLAAGERPRPRRVREPRDARAGPQAYWLAAVAATIDAHVRVGAAAA